MTKNVFLEGKDYIKNFFRYKKYNSNLYLLTSDVGTFSFLNEENFYFFKKGKIVSKDLFLDLENSFIILTKKNIQKFVHKLMIRYSFLINGTSLHIVAPTFRCNLQCTYCFASATDIKNKNYDMSEETAKKIVDFIFSSPQKPITIEFQGGEATVNFDMIKFIVTYAKEKNKLFNKDLRFALVSNLTLMTEEKANWLIDNDVSICTSLDGPKNVHDKNRVFRAKNGEKIGSYDIVVKWIKRINEIYKEKGIRRRVNALPTISRYSLPYYKEIIDEYIKHEIYVLDLRPITYIGDALQNEDEISFPISDFKEFYMKSLDYINELNKKIKEENPSKIIIDRIKELYEKKILENTPGYHTDFESPCGALTGQIFYHYDGSIYTCNEGIGKEEFKVGNVFEDTWQTLFEKMEVSKAILSSMLESNVMCDRCAFKPYCGTCMVENFYSQGKFNFYPTKSQKHHITIMQSKKIFDKLLKNKKNN
jgi:His-Xaa-Ser system radical SAM maturase HxsB